MKENNLNRQSSVMITCLLSICLLMVLSYIGISNTRVTYSATNNGCPKDHSYLSPVDGLCYEDDCYVSNVAPGYYKDVYSPKPVAAGATKIKCNTLRDKVSEYENSDTKNCRYVSVSDTECNITCDKKELQQCVGVKPEPNDNSSSDDTGITYTITFKNGNTTVATKSCTKASASAQCLGSGGKNGVGILAPGAVTAPEGKEFTGWGGKSGCTNATYGSSYWFDQVAASTTYYACFKDKTDVEKDEEKPDDFDATKCTYSSANVTRDQRYLNCKYANISYVSAALTTAANVKACCEAKGFTWVTSNFASGYEYCIHSCSSSNPGGNGGTGGSGGGGGSHNDTPSNPNPDNNNPPSEDNSNVNVNNNPQTGSIAIFIVWIIALATGVYAIWYFKKLRVE